MIRGQLGVRGIAEGLLILVRLPYKSIKLILKDPENDNLRW
jgi:hypothetical protein